VWAIALLALCTGWLAERTGAPPARTIAQFWTTWSNVCLRACKQNRPDADSSGECMHLKPACNRNGGCFNFSGGARCFEDARDRELEDPEYALSRRGSQGNACLSSTPWCRQSSHCTGGSLVALCAGRRHDRDSILLFPTTAGQSHL
jgi:hypothetical protein